MVCNVVFSDEGWYDQDAVCRHLRITAKAVGLACRSGELKCSTRGGRRFFRGSWLNKWLSVDLTETQSAPLH